jgi:hypothetical protein
VRSTDATIALGPFVAQVMAKMPDANETAVCKELDVRPSPSRVAAFSP